MDVQQQLTMILTKLAALESRLPNGSKLLEIESKVNDVYTLLKDNLDKDTTQVDQINFFDLNGNKICSGDDIPKKILDRIGFDHILNEHRCESNSLEIRLPATSISDIESLCDKIEKESYGWTSQNSLSFKQHM